MKYLRNPDHGRGVTQSEISDELAALWRSRGNTEIMDEPLPGVEIVPSYIVTDSPVQE